MNSYHFNRDAGYNNENWGLGFQYDPNNVYSANWGRFINSENDWSNYVTGTWYPLVYKKMRVGILAGAFDGYKKEKIADKSTQDQSLGNRRITGEGQDNQ